MGRGSCDHRPQAVSIHGTPIVLDAQYPTFVGSRPRVFQAWLSRPEHTERYHRRHKDCGDAAKDKRHTVRHRYEFNNEFREELGQAGLIASGTSPDGGLVEICEIRDHPFMVGTQFHPELRSRPGRPHPLFNSFVRAALERQVKRSKKSSTTTDRPSRRKASASSRSRAPH